MPEIEDDDFSFFQKRILALSGIHLSGVKRDLVRARLIARLDALGFSTIKDYRNYLGRLASHDSEWQQLVNQITTNKTDFFREPAHFKYLLENFLPAWEARSRGARLRVWSAACSTGEEPYTLAMVLQRFFRDENRFEILASDIDTDVLEKASNGVYPMSRLVEIPFDYHSSGIVKGKGEVQKWFKIRSSLQSRVRFARVNLLELDQANLGAFDIILCRNVFIYFQVETIQEIIASFHKALNPHGALILGHSESLNVDHKRWKPYGSSIYLKDGKNPAGIPMAVGLPSSRSAKPLLKKSKVLILDGSLAFQKALRDVFQDHARLEVVSNSSEISPVDEMVRVLKPDLILFDLRLQKSGGSSGILERLLQHHGIPVVVTSAAGKEDSPEVLKAFEMGAIDSLQKPSSLEDLQGLKAAWTERLLEASLVKVRKRRFQGSVTSRPKTAAQIVRHVTPFIVIGASTGGVQALTEVLTQLPDEIPPILIVQHMPPTFSAAFAERLNTLCSFAVKEASDGDLVQENQVLIAPGARHMEVISSQQGYKVSVKDGDPVNRHKPSVDVLFHSAARHFGGRAIGILLTGMGVDGAAGLKRLKEQGARTIVQDEASSTVFGMPKEAIRLGAADTIASLEQIPGTLLRLVRSPNHKKKVS